MVANTLWPGSGLWTWSGPKGTKARIDYILYESDPNVVLLGAGVDEKIELADVEKDDHRLVWAHLEISTEAASTKTADSKSNAMKLDPIKLSDPELCEDFERHIWTFEAKWGSSVDQHLSDLTSHIKTKLDI